jgi:hypothetical protein
VLKVLDVASGSVQASFDCSEHVHGRIKSLKMVQLPDQGPPTVGRHTADLILRLCRVGNSCSRGRDGVVRGGTDLL